MRPRTCPNCNGSGILGLLDEHSCPICGGCGIVPWIPSEELDDVLRIIAEDVDRLRERIRDLEWRLHEVEQ